MCLCGRGGGWRGGREAKEAEWLPGRVEMVYWMHIVILFSCQGDLSSAEEIRSSYFGLFLFFITAWRRNVGFRMHISSAMLGRRSRVCEYTLVCARAHTHRLQFYVLLVSVQGVC